MAEVKTIDPNTVLVEENLAQASTKGEEGLPHTGDDAVASTAAEGHGAAAEPMALGLDATAWVSLAMIAVLAIMLWKKVPAAIGKALDKKIARSEEHTSELQSLMRNADAVL